MKILHISGAKGWGGNEQQMLYILPELQQLGCENVIYGVQDSVLQQLSAPLAIRFIAAKAPKLNKWANYADLKKVIQREKPDLLHLHTSDALTVFTLADALHGLGVKAVFSKKGMGSSSSMLSKFKYNYRNVCAIFCVSQSVERDFSVILSERNRSKTRVIHDSVALSILDTPAPFDLREKYSISATQKVVGNIANHSAAKDISTLIATVDHWVNGLGRTDITLVQMGEFSKLTPAYLAEVENKNLTKNIVFTDKISQAFALNPQLDVFLMTSQREGGPTSVLEALLFGSAVVSTKVGVVPQAIEHGKTGYIAEVKDAIALAKYVIDLVDHPEKAKSFGQTAAPLIAQHFNAQTIARQTLEAYQELVN